MCESRPPEAQNGSHASRRTAHPRHSPRGGARGHAGEQRPHAIAPLTFALHNRNTTPVRLLVLNWRIEVLVVEQQGQTDSPLAAAQADLCAPVLDRDDLVEVNAGKGAKDTR